MSSLSNAASPKVKIAVIGGGLIGPRHAMAILKNKSCILSALVDPAAHGSSTAASLNTSHYPSIAALLASKDKPDAAVICTPNHTHVSLSLELMAAGVHILVEKPLSTTIADGKRLIEACNASRVKLLVGHHRRFNPYLQSSRTVLESQQLGQVIAVQGIWSLKKHATYFNELGEWRRSADSGGVILINLIHEIDLLQYLLGPIRTVSALPTIKTRQYAAEEGAVVLLRFESGVVGTFVLSDNCPSPWNFEGGTGENPLIPKVGEAGGFYRILGTEGALSVPDMTIWKGEWNNVLRQEKAWVDEGKVPFDVQIEHFVGVIRGEVEPNCRGEDALGAMVVCEAIRKAVWKGNGMPIDIKGFEIVETKAKI